MSLPPRPPAPPGYHCAFDNDWFRPWICDRCGASVVTSASATHDAWHENLAQTEREAFYRGAAGGGKRSRA